MIYVHYFNEETTIDGYHHKQGEIYYISDSSTGAENCVQVTFDEAKKHDLFNYLYIDGKLVYDVDANKKRVTEELRKKREEILAAFDKYKSNLLFGIEKEIGDRDGLIEWYYKVLALDEKAIKEPMKCIQKYLK